MRLLLGGQGGANSIKISKMLERVGLFAITLIVEAIAYLLNPV